MCCPKLRTQSLIAVSLLVGALSTGNHAMAGDWFWPGIKVTDVGDPVGEDGSVYGSLQRYLFTVERQPEEPLLNAVAIRASATDDEIHQVWPFGGTLATPDEFTAAFAYPNAQLDSHAILGGTANDPLFDLVIGNTEDLMIPGGSPVAGVGGGYGGSASIDAAVTKGNEQKAYDVYQLVLPDTMVGTVAVEILSAYPYLDEPYSRTFVFDDTHSPSTAVDTINPQGSVDMGADWISGIDFSFENVTAEGVFTSDYAALTQEQIADLSEELLASIDFAFAGGPLQLWDVDFTGEFDGLATLTIAYDYTALGVPEGDLFVAHQLGSGEWEILTGVVDTEAHTITIVTDSFSPFVLGAVPEPGTLATLLFGGAALLRRRR